MSQTDTAVLSQKQSGHLWIAIILGSLASFGPLSIDMYLPAFPELALDFHSTASFTQMSLTACLLGLALGQLIAGPISDVRGRRFPLIAGVAIYSLVSLLCVFSPNMTVLILLRFLQGLAGAVGIVISRASARDLFSGVQLTKFFALLMLVNGAAPILAPIIGAQVLEFTSWRGVFTVLSGIGFLMLLGVVFGMKETLPVERRSRGGIRNTLKTFRRLLGDSLFMGYALTQGLIMAAMFAYISGSPFVLQELYGVSPQMYSLIFGVNAIGIITAGQFAGRLAGRVSDRSILNFGLAMASVGAVMLLIGATWHIGLIIIIPGLFLVVASVGLIATTTSSLALQNQGQNAGTASALLGMLSFIIGGAVAPLVGLRGTLTVMPLAIVMAALVLAAVLCYTFGARGDEVEVTQ